MWSPWEDLMSQMKLIKLFFPATCYRPGSVVGDLWWLAGGHAFGGQVHNSQEAYEKHDGTYRNFKGKLASQNSSALENKVRMAGSKECDAIRIDLGTTYSCVAV